MAKILSFAFFLFVFILQILEQVDGFTSSLSHHHHHHLLLKQSLYRGRHSPRHYLSYGSNHNNQKQQQQQQQHWDSLHDDENALRSPKDMVTIRVRKFIHRALSLAVLTTAITTNTNTNNNNNQAQAKVFTEDDYLDSLATVILAKKVMEPANQYVELQAYDNARTNIKYILNDLQLQKKVTNLVQSSIDFAEDVEAVDAAGEAAGRIANTAMQYDSTVYTCVFIPSEDGSIPPNAMKYRKQAKEFYEAFNQDADILIKVATTEQLTKAQRLASDRISKLPVVLFKNENLKQTGI